MECKSEKCKKIRVKEKQCALHKLDSSSNSSFSSDSETFVCPFELCSRKNRKRKLTQQGQQRKDYLTKLFEKKKLKDKSLSKKMKTPLDRQINRTCWPIELEKVSKIKKRPKEKKKGKPTHKSLKKKKSFSPSTSPEFRDLNSYTESRTEIFDEQIFNELLECAKTTDCFIYEPVTPQMLIDVLKDPELLKGGATLDMIITKLRALKLGLNPSIELLKEEVLQKLKCAMKLRIIVEKNGYYMVADTPVKKLTRKKVDAFWDLWYRRFYKCKKHKRH